jgi:replication factor C large subunit
MWSEKYRPTDLKEMVGNESPRLEVLRWLSTWEPGGEICLLLGPPGTGKTTVAHVAGRSLGFVVLELNASDTRTRSKLSTVLSPLNSNTTLHEEKILVFLDEVDGIGGREDYGGVDFVLDIASGSRFPIITAANKHEDENVRKLSKKAKVIRFKEIPPREISVYLNRICKLENKEIPSPALLGEVIRAGKGDMRLTINLLQSTFAEGRGTPLAGRVAGKDQALELRAGIGEGLQSSSPQRQLQILRQIRCQPKDKVRALLSSVTGNEIAEEPKFRALDALARADVLLAQINKTQNWKLLRYFDRMLVEALGILSRQKGVSFSEDDVSWATKLRIWNDARAMAEVERALGKAFKMGSKTVFSVMLPYLFLLLKQDPTLLTLLTHRFNFSESAVRVLIKESRITKVLVSH